jgi:uncharacterized membrane protein YkoI
MKVFSSLAALLAWSVAASAAEQKIQMKDLPAPVQKAAQEQAKGATIRGFTKEVENGKTEYEAQLTVNGHAKDISFDSTGKVLAVEEEVTIDSLPTAARAAIQKAAEGGTVKRVESVTEGGKSFFEASISKNGKSSEVQVDANGSKIK